MRFVITGDDTGAGEAGRQAVVSALIDCPDAVVEILVFGFQKGGTVLSDEGRACITQQVTAHAREIVAAMTAEDTAVRERESNYLTPCAGLLGV